MRRRALLGALGTAALAGCSSDGDGGAPAPAATTDTATGTVTGTAGSAEFELVGINSPERIQLNAPSLFRIGVRNVGSAAGTFTSPLQTRTGSSEWETIGEVTMELAAGELGEWRSPTLRPTYLRTREFRLVAFDETWSIEFVPRELDFGVRYTVPNGLYVSVVGGSFEETYPRFDGNETGTTPTPTPTAPTDGGKWAVMRVDVRNRLQESQPAPEPSTFGFEVNGESREPTQAVAADPYRAGELDARTVERGEFVYPVPADTRVRDLRMWYADSLPDGDVKAVWTK